MSNTVQHTLNKTGCRSRRSVAATSAFSRAVPCADVTYEDRVSRSFHSEVRRGRQRGCLPQNGPWS